MTPTDLPGEISGSHPLRAWLNKLRRAVIARTPALAPGYRIREGMSGFTLEVLAGAGGGGGSDAATYLVAAVKDDYLVCREWTGTLSDTLVYIARSPVLRQSLWDDFIVDVDVETIPSAVVVRRQLRYVYVTPTFRTCADVTAIVTANRLSSSGSFTLALSSYRLTVEGGRRQIGPLYYSSAETPPTEYQTILPRYGKNHAGNVGLTYATTERFIGETIHAIPASGLLKPLAGSWAPLTAVKMKINGTAPTETLVNDLDGEGALQYVPITLLQLDDGRAWSRATNT